MVLSTEGGAAMVQPGMKLRDNDPRFKGRVVTVKSVLGDYAQYQAGKRTAKIRLDRIYDDGKERKSGFSVVR